MLGTVAQKNIFSEVLHLRTTTSCLVHSVKWARIIFCSRAPILFAGFTLVKNQRGNFTLRDVVLQAALFFGE